MGAGTRRNFSFRIVIFLLACGLASHKMVGEWIQTVHGASPYRAVILAPFAAALLAIYTQLSNRRVIEIHDRHVDFLTTSGAIFMAIVIDVLLAPRLHWAASSLRLDLATIPFWVFALTCGLYGTRRAIDQGPAFGVLTLTWPLPYSIAGSVLKVPDIGWMIVGFIVSATLVGVIKANYPTRLAIWGACCLASAIVCRVMVGREWLCVPVVIAIFAVVVRLRHLTLLRIPTARTVGKKMTSRPEGKIAVKSSRRVILPFLFGSLIIGLLPSQSVEALARPAQTMPADGCRTPVGWSLQRQLVLNPPDQVHLGQWTTQRCVYRVPADGATRGVAIDVGADVSDWELGAFPWPSTMKFVGAMEPQTRQVPLDGGKADVFVFSDPTIPTATTVISWTVQVKPGLSRRIAVIVPDDRRTVATFPTPESHLGSVLVRWMLSVTRTQANQLRKFAVTPKDQAFLLSSANSIIASWKS